MYMRDDHFIENSKNVRIVYVFFHKKNKLI